MLDLPFEDDTFDVVFSHGVLHHVPDIDGGQREIHRVLKPGGELIVMVYARWSLNYLVAIGIARGRVLLATYPFVRNRRTFRGGKLEAHVRNAQRTGLARYLRMREFVHSNTDGPGNPFSNVYDERRLRRDFSMFRVTKSYKRFMHAPPLPVHDWRGGSLLGWHLWAHMRAAPQPDRPVSVMG